MSKSLRALSLMLALILCTLGAQAQTVSVMAWNIWRGGRENGTFTGPKQVIDVIKRSRADLVLIQETYGSGEIMARGLGFHALYRGTNLSLYSRYPIEEDISVNDPFNCVGAIIRVPNGKKAAVYSIWLPYGEDIWIPATRAKATLAQMLSACQPSEQKLKQMLQQIEQRLSGEKYKGIPVIIGGDFNSMSHLDYTEVAREHYGNPISWPTSKLMTDAGFRDSFREMNPIVDRMADCTWSPRFRDQEQERIDFIYYRGTGITAARSERIEKHGPLFPSDHAAVQSELKVNPNHTAPRATNIRAASYNIRHGAGMDDKLDLDRSIRAIRRINADIIALQEMDDRTKRTNQVNQTVSIAKELKMHNAFGNFMAYDGGYFGLSVLSRYPIVETRPLRLPDGGEPRIALLVDVRLPNNDVVTVVNVHFDWLGNDANRFKQASLLADALKQLKTPYILLGDFNDGPASRTLALFKSLAAEAKKPAGATYTFPASKPDKEIDYIFAGPASRWQVGAANVVDEKLASDHRPIRSTLTLTH